MSNDKWPIKSRYLFLAPALSLGIAVIFSPNAASSDLEPMADVIWGLIFYGSFFLLIRKFAKLGEISWSAIFGGMKIDFFTSRYILIIIPLIAISFASIYLLYLPISFVFPNFVEEWVINTEISVLWKEGINYRLANVLSFLIITQLAPIVEEIFFRGFLLTSLAQRWSVNKSVIFSSIVFAVFHVDIIGGFVCGVVVAFLYLKTKSLYVSVIIHIANNTVAFIAYYFFSLSGDSDKYTLIDFQGDWWIGVIGLVIGIPWLIRFFKKEIVNHTFTLPYFNNMVR